jgi:chromatin assembly factor 1 subunit B
MKATPLLVQWHEENAAIYSAHFAPHGTGRLATAGSDNTVRVGNPLYATSMLTGQIWRVEQHNEERKVIYLSTLSKHQQTVNVVRWSPRGASNCMLHCTY